MTRKSTGSKWFCRSTSTSRIDGPFDLVELAGLLRSGDITEETLINIDGEDAWTAFKDRNEFDIVKNMPADVIYRHLKNELEKKESPWSLRHLYYFILFFFGVVGHGLWGGIRPTWQIHKIQNLVLDALHRISGH